VPGVQRRLSDIADQSITRICGGAATGMWPCQVTDEQDAERQEPILRAIVECELHERIFPGHLASDPSIHRPRW